MALAIRVLQGLAIAAFAFAAAAWPILLAMMGVYPL